MHNDLIAHIVYCILVFILVTYIVQNQMSSETVQSVVVVTTTMVD